MTCNLITPVRYVPAWNLLCRSIYFTYLTSVSDPVFFSRIRIGISLFYESGSGSAKNPDPDPWKKRPKIGVKVKKILYFISSTLNIVLFGQAPPKPYQNHHLDPISLLMDGSGLLKPGSGSAKKPGSIRIRIRNTGIRPDPPPK